MIVGLQLTETNDAETVNSLSPMPWGGILDIGNGKKRKNMGIHFGKKEVNWKTKEKDGFFFLNSIS